MLICRDWKNHMKLNDNLNRTPHYLVLSGTSTVTAEKILEQYKPGLVIFDATYKNREKKQLQLDLNRAGVACFDIAESGAFLTRDF